MKREIKYRVEDGNLLIDKKNEEEMNVQIFDNKGMLLKQFLLKESTKSVILPQKGIYLVVVQAVNETFINKITWE